MNSEHEVVVGAKIRPRGVGGNARMPDSTIIAIDGDEVWVRPISKKDGPPFTALRQQLYTDWETWVEPDPTNLTNVHISDLFPGVVIDGIDSVGPVHISHAAALNMAAWILQILNPGYREWADLQQAIRDLCTVDEGAPEAS